MAMKSASSYHPGGVNCALFDGSVRFVNETVNTGTLSANPVDSGSSPYGVWGALGSINGVKVNRYRKGRLPPKQKPEWSAAQ